MEQNSRIDYDFELLYNENKKLVYTFITDYTKDPYIIMEIQQSIWAKVYENLEKFSDKEKRDVQNYLRAVTRNTIADYFNNQKREERLFGELYQLNAEYSEECATVEDIIFAEDIEEYLRYAKNLLSKEDKDLLMLKYERGLDSKTIGDLYGKSDVYIRVRLKRIRDFLKKEILEQQRKEYGDD